MIMVFTGRHLLLSQRESKALVTASRMDHIHKMTLFLLIAGALVHTSYSEDEVTISLSPEFVKVISGSSLNLTCNFHMLNGSRVNWMFTKTIDTSNLQKLTLSHNEEDRIHQKKGKYWSRLTVRNVTVNDSGWYFCEVRVEIPILKNLGLSNGSQVIVDDTSTASTNMTGVWIWVGAGTGVAVVISLILIWILWRRKRRLERENPLYENTTKVQTWAPKQPSPRPCVQTAQSRILTQNALKTPTQARAHEKSRIYQNTHPTTRSCTQKTEASRTRVQTESKTATYENVRAAKPARKHPNKVRPKV
ncbi:uncharacterized protein LOC116222176 isoform X2 [Clupea harengus]|uniref:Uncharacterized protein LOC116222176 isoform X2 n=2 Tax=Clupea harengus TaxID=7950 RepID=A0A6P8FTH2_CLUHA|nr:uncharacterized protein LOC116222176 isoform X2 [Clupea harengus]